MDKIAVTTNITATPKLVAELFWSLDSVQQAQFFSELHDITEKQASYGLGEMQWCYMSDEIDKLPKAKAQACSMMVWIFNRATDFLSHYPKADY